MAGKNQQTGSVDIALRKPITVAGVEVKALRMREPTVEDQLAVQDMSGNDVQRELHMMANLCMVAPEELRKLGLHDYRKVQTAFTNFID